MPWPAAFDRLLTGADTRAAQALRWGLCGLRASLRKALDEAPDDPGGADLRDLLRELDPLVDRPRVSPGPVLPPDDVGDGAEPSVTPPADDDLLPLAGVAAACLRLAGRDPRLCHCLRSVFRFGVTPLAGEQRERFTAELVRLWERLRSAVPPPSAAKQGWKDCVKACLDFDEAVHSLVYRPPAGPDPALDRLQGQSREVLGRLRDRAVQAGCPVHLQALGGNFADISQLAPDSLQVDFGVPGEVSVCLRVWARLDGEEMKGRVLYRSPQDNFS
jgi:hypothetical protein